jgi:hypothetical protein
MPGPQSESAIIPAVVALPESNRSPLPLGGVSGVPTLIQSRCGNKGNFELLTPMASGGLAHYCRNNDDPFVPWFGPIRFGQEAGGFEAVGMIQSKFGDSGNLEVVGRVADRLVFFLARLRSAGQVERFHPDYRRWGTYRGRDRESGVNSESLWQQRELRASYAYGIGRSGALLAQQRRSDAPVARAHDLRAGTRDCRVSFVY